MGFNLIDTIKGITEGTINSIFVKEEIEKMAEERLAICRMCPFNSEVAKKNDHDIIRPDEHCLKCGCNLHLKSRYPSAHCPLTPPKWGSLATDEESEKLMELLDKNNNDKNVKDGKESK